MNSQAQNPATRFSEPLAPVRHPPTHHRDCSSCRRPWRQSYNERVEKKIFWIVFMVLGLVADIVLPLWWGLVATIPIAVVSWWVAYRSEWF